ncbi:unnamed protein product [Parajaminaea phylloscopi]
MDDSTAGAGPGPSSFLSFATSLADSRHLTLAGRLSSGDASDPDSPSAPGQLGTAIRFAQVCLEKAAAAEGAELGHEPLGGAFDEDSDDEGFEWSLEARTWELLHYLCADRYLHNPQSDGQLLAAEDGPDFGAKDSLYYQTPFAAVQDVLLRNRGLRELKIVRDWLSSQLPAVHIAEVRKGYAPFSKNRLRAEKRTQIGSRTKTSSSVMSTSSSIVKSLDPDAESRGQGHWDMEDANYSKALHKTLFEYARSGQLGAAFDLCRQADHPWRAASLRGAMLYHQRGLNGMDDDEDAMLADDAFSAGGNRNRLLWKAVCKRLAANNTLEPYERALYGSLSGHLTSVLAVSSPSSWEEHLWAYVNTCLEGRIDSALESQGQRDGAGAWWTQDGGAGSIRIAELRSEQQGSRAAEDISTEVRDIFTKVRGTPNARSHQGNVGESDSIRLQADDPYHIVQQAVILDEIPQLLIHVESRLAEMRATIRPKRYAHLVRFFAHLVLYLRLLGTVELPASSCNSILRHYVEVLEHVVGSKGASQMDAAEGDLVAMYASSLERESAEESYAHYLKGLNDTATAAEKQDALLRAKQHELDVAAVARLVVQVIFSESFPLLQQQSHSLAPDALSADTTTRVDLTPAESRLVSSIEWLTFLPGTRHDAVFQSNALMRALLSRNRINAARTLLYSMPAELLDGGASEPSGLQDSPLDGGELRGSDRTEHLHYHSFFHLLSTQIALVEVLSQRPTATKTSGVKRTDLFAWKQALVDLARRVQLESEELLRGDWLKLPPLDPESDKEEAEQSEEDVVQEEDRQVELARIRQLYVPELVFRLHFLVSDAHAALWALDAQRTADREARGQALDVDGEDDEEARQLLDYITADLPILVADERYKVYLEFVSAGENKAASQARATSGAARGSGSSNNRLKDYLGHVRSAYLVKLGGGGERGPRTSQSLGSGTTIALTNPQDPFSPAA